ncbi:MULTISPECIES: efflux transporter outer membrane subunit [unclassified Sphingomonas]|uniref:efflux transporter outer membrane subunit n=1 Tax=unclassified Sphingomonas TaxID=196159 RepID=UPI00082D92F7|nr:MULTISPECIES: efflux transporter outer membrane subunit [unclassified Sphingomonas]
MIARAARAATVLLATTLLAGCVVGPDFETPLPDAPAQGAFVESKVAGVTLEEPPAAWWRLFRAPLLDGLVDQALANNTDLRAAAANLREARAALSESRAGLLPTTTLTGQQSYSRTPLVGFGGAGAFETPLYNGGLDVNYQVDLFGRITRTIQASRADYQAVQAVYDRTRISVVADTTRAYAQVCALGRQIAVARESLRVQQETFGLTERQYQGGRGTALEVSRARSQLEQTRAGIPNLEASRRSALYALAVLTGKPPAEFPQELATCVGAPVLDTPVPIGDGATLIARRPDIREAERRLAAATARIGVATAALYPNISIGGSIGGQAATAGDVFNNRGFRFNFGPLISWTFPNITAARAQIRQAEASADAALAGFDGAWLGALREVESTLAQYSAALETRDTLARARSESDEAARIARLRYRAGRENFQVVLDAERELATTEAQLADAQAQLADLTVTLFLALGGGWEQVPA